VPLDAKAVTAMFSLPRSDGLFEAEFGDYLRTIGRRRKVAMAAFPPKAAGTFFCAAVIEAVDGQLVRGVHAQGGRDATPYLPTFVHYYNDGPPSATLVTHLHMQALPANCHFIEAFDIRPVIMVRSIPDMLVSYWDMLDADPADPSNWLNCILPPHYSALPAGRKADFLVDTIGPWYASYYASWIDYASRTPDRVCVLRYRHFRSDPAAALETALAHMGLPRTREVCARAIDTVRREGHLHRFNQGIEGRGFQRFDRHQLSRIARLLSYHRLPADITQELLPATNGPH
jgi:hypothetical protein